MLHAALRPKNLALLALVLVLSVVFVMLGNWQLGVAHDHAQADALAAGPKQPVVALDSYLKPQSAFPKNGSLRRVRATGTYDAAHQVLVADRRLDGRPGLWVVTPLVVDGTGARLAVVRGFVTSEKEATPPTTTGTVTVVGALAPGESPSDMTLPNGQVGSIDLGKLLNVWGGDIYNAFVFGMSEQPDATSSQIVKIPPPTLPASGLNWRNAGYALQWWAFALFALYLWWRTVREDHRDAQVAAGVSHNEEAAGSPASDDDDQPAPPDSAKDLHV